MLPPLRDDLIVSRMDHSILEHWDELAQMEDRQLISATFLQEIFGFGVFCLCLILKASSATAILQEGPNKFGSLADSRSR